MKLTTQRTLGAVFGIAALMAVSTSAAQQADVIVGTMAALTGTNARSGQEQLRGVQLWVAEVNERGGLLGARVQLKHYDDRGEFEAGAGMAEKLIAEDGAVLLIGPSSADVTPAVASVAERHGVPMVAPGNAAAELWARGYKNLFALYSPPEASLHHVLVFARSRGLRRVALLYQDSAFAREVAQGVRARSRSLGLRVVFDENYDAALTDFTPIVTKLKPKRPDVILVASHLPDSIGFMRNAKEQGLSARILAFAGGANLPEFGSSLGPDAEGAVGGTQWEPALKLAGVADFARRFKVKYGHDPGYLAAGGYAAGQVLEAAVKKAGSIDPTAMRKALSELDTITVFGRYRVDAAGRQVGKSGYIVQWIDGARVPVLPTEVAAGKPVYPFRSWGRR